MPESSYASRLIAASLDTFTAVSCIAYWAGTWNVLDAYKLNQVFSGLAAVVVIFFLAIAAANERLAKLTEKVPPLAEAVLAWLWTCFLAVLSILIWRMCWYMVDKIFFDPSAIRATTDLSSEIEAQLHVENLGSPGKVQMSNYHAIILTMVGAFTLVAAGRYRSASHAPPIGIVADTSVAETCFAKPVFSGSDFKHVLLDFFLTLPVVFVWAGVWKLNDNAKLDPLLSALICLFVVALLAVVDIDEILRDACVGRSLLVHNLGDLVFTSILVVLVVGVWRGVWEAIDHNLHLAKNAHIAALIAAVGAIGLTALQRHRSALFPPVDFSVDDGDHFASVGHTTANSLLPDNCGPAEARGSEACTP
jgi:hypothetical protein